MKNTTYTNEDINLNLVRLNVMQIVNKLHVALDDHMDELEGSKKFHANLVEEVIQNLLNSDNIIETICSKYENM